VNIQMTEVSSSWVHSIGIDSDMGQSSLYVQYKDKDGNLTVCCRYDGFGPDEYRQFLRARSKGRWVHANLMGRSYTIV
jgi:hypothetical protein